VDVKKNMEDFKRLEAVIPDMRKVMEYTGKDEVVSSYDAERHYLDHAPPLFSVKTGIITLDRMTEGFCNGELITISGLTKHGKTTLAQTFTTNFGKQEINPVWFSYELPGRIFLKKFPKLPLFYLPLQMTESGLKWIEAKIQESIVKYGSKAVFIDHLHYLVPMSAAVNMSLMIGAVMRELKKMTLKYNIIIFIIAHTKKLSYNKKPDLDDIRDSSFISQESDFVLMINRRTDEVIIDGEKEMIFTKEAKLFLLANRRNGNQGVIKLRHENNTFFEIEKENEEYK